MASEDISHVTQEAGKLFVSEKEMFSYKDDSYHSGFTTRLVAMREEKLLTDITLKAGEVSVPCHKLALAAASPYFYRLINCEQATETLMLQNISPSVLRVIIDFVYTSEVEIRAELVKELSISCDVFQLDSLKKACDNFIAEKVEPANAIGLFAFACDHNLDTTRKAAERYLKTQAENVLRLALDAEYKTMNQDALIQWISGDDLEVSTEDSVFLIVERWVHADSSRKDESCLEQVFSHVRLPLCSPEFLVRRVKASPLLENKKCRKYLDEATSFMILKLAASDKEDLQSERTRPRKCLKAKEKLVLIGGVSDGVANQQCWYKEDGDQQWKELTTLPSEQMKHPYYFNACAVGDGIILTGGRERWDGGTTTSKAWLLNMSTNTWQDIPPMSQARCEHGMVAVGDTIYVMGGYCLNTSLASVERLDSTRKQWTNMAPLKHATCYCHAFLINGDIFLLSSASTKKTQKYNIAKDDWQVVGEVPKVNYPASMINIGDNIYVVGGNNDTQSMLYDTKSDTWTLLAKTKRSHYIGSALKYESSIVISGGGSTNKLTSCSLTTEQYDLQSDQWSECPLVLPKPLASHVMIEWKG